MIMSPIFARGLTTFFFFFLAFTGSASARDRSFSSGRRSATSRALEAAANLTTTVNSGICETTPGVNQTSGYLQVGNASIFFWYFESRNAPETAPWTLWLNGGPGCSSMIGLFQENGPCTINANQESVLNPYSWNNVSNMIYIDQPVGAGFSFGSPVVKNTTETAPVIWSALQILLQSAQFSKFQSREFIFATESYGARFAPIFINYFNAQNALVDSGNLQGVKIVVSALMINDGKHDPLIQYESYIDFATDAPGYGRLQPAAVVDQMSSAYYGANGCQTQLQACYAAGISHEADVMCEAAEQYCNHNVFIPAIKGYDSDDLRQNSSGSFPPSDYKKFLKNDTVVAQIGATGPFHACDNSIKAEFGAHGELARSFLPQLAQLADAKLPILIWVGDADIKANWLGVYKAMTSMNWYGNNTLNNTTPTNMTIDGVPVAAIQRVDNFTFARVYGAGHGLPAYQPKTALEIFSQVVQMQPLHSVPGSPGTTSASPSGSTLSPGATATSGSIRSLGGGPRGVLCDVLVVLGLAYWLR